MGGAAAAAGPPATVVVKTADGREIRGVRRNEDTFSLQMVDTAGQLHLLDKLKLASVVVAQRSRLHPTDYASRLSADEIANLVAYLRTLNGRDRQDRRRAAGRRAASPTSASATRRPNRTTG